MTATDISTFARAPWRELTEADFGKATRVPTMLNPEERQLYVWLTWRWASGNGCVVDLGSFAGGSTALLAEGQRKDDRQGRIHAFDKFTISDKHKEQFLYRDGFKPFDGNDLLPAAKQFLKHWAPNIIFHKGRIEEQQWSGEDIELLVMDASKTTATMDRMAEMFFPFLIPGKSVVLQQDFLHWKQPWIAVQMTLLKDYFTPLARCPKDQVVFLCERRIDADALAAAATAKLTDAEMLTVLAEAEVWLANLRMGRRIRKLILSLEDHPGRRAAWNFKRKPK